MLNAWNDIPMSGRITRLLILVIPLILILLPMVTVHSSPSYAKIHLPPVSDTYILKDCSRCKMFNRSELRVGYQAVGVKGGPFKVKASYRNNSNILIIFNLSKIPPGAEIKTARLWLYVMNPPEDQVTLYLHVLKEEYNETHVNWIQRNYTRMWRTKGGYADPNYLQKVRVDDSISEGDVVGFLVTDYVRKVHSGEIKDYGLLLRSDVTPLTYRDIRFGEVISYYVDFYSLEGSKRLMRSSYRPDLYVEFVKPTAILSASQSSLNLERGETATLSISEEGTFSGIVGLAYRVVEAPGPKVGPLDIRLSNYKKQRGFSVNVTVKVGEYAPPGKYVVEFYPDTGDYGPEVVEYGKAYLTITVSSEASSTMQTQTQSQTQATSQTLSSSPSETTPTSTASTPPPSTTTTPPTKSVTLTTNTTTKTKYTYTTEENESMSSLLLPLGVLAILLAILVPFLARRR